MMGLGVLGDAPPNAIQPPLRNGIHLRWAFSRTRGSPWHGFYLYRRAHLHGDPICLSREVGALAPGPLPGFFLDVSFARLSSDTRLTLTENWPRPGEPVNVYQAGTVSVTNNSPLVSGAGTNWTAASHAGLVLQVGTDTAAYVVAAVLAPNRLVLSRPYGGATGSARAYSLQRDAFAQLHDYLAHTVAGGPAAGPMAGRTLPAPLLAAGTVSTTGGSAVVNGAGTNWAPTLAGLRFRVIAASAGTITATRNSEIIRGTGTTWAADLVGMELEVGGDDRAYRIAEVYAANRLRLDRPYEGPDSVSAYRIAERPLYRVLTVNSPTRLTLDAPYGGATAAGRRYELAVVLQAPGSPNQAPRLPRFRPLDVVLVGALDPAVAQMLGLYWVDETADPGSTYDYLLLADNNGLGNNALAVLNAWVQSRYANTDGFIAFNLRMGAAAPLAAPTGARAYALPNVTLTSAAGDVAGSAGLVWGLPVNEDGLVLPRSAVMYHAWRADHGANAPLTPPGAGAFTLRTSSGPIVIADMRSASPATPQRPSDWPPFRLFFTDGNLREGWYSYAVSGIDIFGRHSAASVPAEWWQWAPMPEPRPWYYNDPAADSRVHAYAVGLLDKVPPPPPAAVEAFALDPADPTVLRDNLFNVWRSALDNAVWYQALTAEQRGNVIGLRVSWRWTAGQQAQAPDTREFRIYFRPGSYNALLGRITATADASATSTCVTTDIPNNAPADAYAGTRLHHGNDNWEVVGSDPASPLRVRVQNIGPGDDIRPPTRGPCSVVIPDHDPPHPRFADYSRSTVWQERFHVVPYDANWRAERPLPAGTRIRLYSGAEADAHDADAGLVRRFVAAEGEGGHIHFGGRPVTLRLSSGHRRSFLTGHVALNVRLLRKRDGTGFFVVPAAPPFPAGEYRFTLTFRRDISAVYPGSQVFSEAGVTLNEVVWLDVPWAGPDA